MIGGTCKAKDSKRNNFFGGDLNISGIEGCKNIFQGVCIPTIDIYLSGLLAIILVD